MLQPPDKTIKNLALATCAMLALALLCGSVQISWRESRDFPQYFAAARMYLSGDSQQIYNAAALGTLEHKSFPNMPKQVALFCYPPFVLPLVSWLGLLTPHSAQKVWTIMSVISALAAFAILTRQCGYSRRTITWSLILCALSGPFCESLIKGQPTSFMLFGLATALFALRKNNYWLCALGLAFLIAKPHLLLPILAFLAGTRRWKLLGIIATIGIALLGISIVTSTTNGYASYFDFMRTVLQDPAVMNIKSCPTLRSQLLRFFPGQPSISTITSAVAYIFMVCASFLLGRKIRAADRQVQCLALVVLPVGALLSIYLQAYDLLLVAPALLALPQVLVRSQNRQLSIALAVVALPLLFAPTYSAAYHAQIAVNPHFWLLLCFAILCASSFRMTGPEMTADAPGDARHRPYTEEIDSAAQ